MGDNNHQKPAGLMPPIQSSDWKSRLTPRAREKVVQKIFDTLRSCCTEPEMLQKAEMTARNFEEKVFAVAIDQQDYMKKISSKMVSMTRARHPADNSSNSYAATGAPRPLLSATENAHQTNHSHPFLQSAVHPQPQPRQMIQNNLPASRGVLVASSSAVATTSGISQAPGSNFAGQSSMIRNISRMPLNIDKNSSERRIPPNLMVASCVPEQQRQHLQQQIHKNFDRQFLTDQQAQYQLPNQHTRQESFVITMGKNPTQPLQEHQNQLGPTMVPYSQQSNSSTTPVEPPSIQSQTASAHMHNEGSPVLHCKQTVSNRAQPALRQQHMSCQPDFTHERKFTAPQKSLPVHGQHESMGKQSNSGNNKQDQSPQSRPPDPFQPQHHLLQPNRGHKVEQRQLLSDRKQITNVHPQRLGSQSTVHNKQLQQQTVERHPVPMVLRGDSLGEQQGFLKSSSSQGPQPYENMISHSQPLVVGVENKPRSCTTTESQNLPRPEAGAFHSGSVPLEVCKTSNVSSGDGHGVAENWREDTYQRIMVLKNQYMSKLEDMRSFINLRLKQINSQPEHPNRDHYHDMNVMTEKMLRFLNVQKEKLVPGHRESVNRWEKLIVHHLNRLSKSKNASSSLQQGQEPPCDVQSVPPLPSEARSPRVQPREDSRENKTQTQQVRQAPVLGQQQRLLSHQQPASLQARIPHQFIESGMREKQLTNQESRAKGEGAALIQSSPQTVQTVRNSQDPKDSQKNVSSTHSRPSHNHQLEAQQPAALSSGKSKVDIADKDSSGVMNPKRRVISPSLSESHTHNEILGTSSNVLSDKTSASLSPFQRLINSVSSMSSGALKSSVDDISSVITMLDGMEATTPRIGSRSAVGQDLVRTTGCRMQARISSQQRDGKTRRSIGPVSPMSIDEPDNLNKSDVESTENHRKRSRTKDATQKLMEEIKDVNHRLVDTMVDICQESPAGTSGSGTVVKCCFSGVSVNSSLMKFMGLSGCSTAIQPLHLLIPIDYPDRSPVLLDKLPGEIGDEYTDLSDKAMSRLGISLRGLEDPISLSQIARTWDICARAVITEHAEKYGGETFSSRYATWENCLGAA